ncbi:DNA pilot protein [Tortoise microvirus 63]|nr:DNA pilot protein [Tortoise microvirus 63]
MDSRMTSYDTTSTDIPAPPTMPDYDYTPSLINAAAGIGSSVINYISQSNTNDLTEEMFNASQKQQQWQWQMGYNQQQSQYDQNMAFQQSQVDWNQNFAERQFAEQSGLSQAQFQAGRADVAVNRERQDTQLQRTVADAQAAGLSPLAALGMASYGAPVSAPSVGLPSASMPSGMSGASGSSPSPGSAGVPHLQAPQMANAFGLGAALDAIAVLGNLELGSRDLDIKDLSRLDSREQQELNRRESARQHDDQLSATKESIANTLQMHGDKLSQEQAQFAEKMMLETSKLQEAIRHNTVGEHQASEKVLRDQLGVQKFAYYKNDADYNIAMATFTQEYVQFQERMLKNGFQSVQKSSTGHFEAKADVAGVVAGSGGFSSTDASRSNETLTYESESARFWSTHSYPMRGY